MADDSSSAHCESFEIVKKLCSLPFTFDNCNGTTSVNFANHLWTIQGFYNFDEWGEFSETNVFFFYVTIKPEILTGESAEIKVLLPTRNFQFHLNLEGPQNRRRKFGPFSIPKSSLGDTDTFTIKFGKQLTKSTDHELFTYNIFPPGVELLENLAELYRNQEICDVTLRVREKEFPAHKTILSAASPVFKAMFANDFREARTNILEIKDFEPNAISEMLQFIYTHEAPEFSSPSINVSSLYEAAHKYEINNLLKLCRNELLSSFDIETALHRLMLADKYDDQDLKQKSLNFICQNPPGLARVLKNKQYFVQRPELLEDILACKFKQNFDEKKDEDRKKGNAPPKEVNLVKTPQELADTITSQLSASMEDRIREAFAGSNFPQLRKIIDSMRRCQNY